jgi:hypothetical protein
MFRKKPKRSMKVSVALAVLGSGVRISYAPQALEAKEIKGTEKGALFIKKGTSFSIVL